MALTQIEKDILNKKLLNEIEERIPKAVNQAKEQFKKINPSNLEDLFINLEDSFKQNNFILDELFRLEIDNPHILNFLKIIREQNISNLKGIEMFKEGRFEHLMSNEDKNVKKESSSRIEPPLRSNESRLDKAKTPIGTSRLG